MGDEVTNTNHKPNIICPHSKATLTNKKHHKNRICIKRFMINMKKEEKFKSKIFSKNLLPQKGFLLLLPFFFLSSLTPISFRSFLESMKILVTIFKPKLKEFKLSSRSISSIFSNADEIYHVSFSFFVFLLRKIVCSLLISISISYSGFLHFFGEF